MTVDNVRGWIVVSALVTDGTDVWLEGKKYLNVTRREARSLFCEHVNNSGWRVAGMRFLIPYYWMARYHGLRRRYWEWRLRRARRS